MIYPFVWNNRRYYRLENKNERLLFSPSASTISHSRTVSVFFFFFHSVHKWILVGNTRSTKWLLPAVLQGELTIQKDHPPGVSPLLTLSGGNQDVIYPSSKRPGEKQPVRNSEAPWTLSFAYSLLVKYLLPQTTKLPT